MNTGFHACEVEKISQNVNLEDKLFLPHSCSGQRSNVPEKRQNLWVFFLLVGIQKSNKLFLCRMFFLLVEMQCTPD